MTMDTDFDPRATACKLLREGRSGALATVMPQTGHPYCSLVNIATAADGAPLILISRLAVHTKNILVDPRVSLMIDERQDGDPLRFGRVTLNGAAEVTPDPEVRRRYLDRQPDAVTFAHFHDFAFYRVTLSGAHLVAGFGRIVDLAASDLLVDLAGADAMVAAEPGIIEHMNADHADACRLYATKLLGGPDGDWRCVGCDPEGLDLQNGRLALRLPFPARVNSPGVLRQVLKTMVETARGMAAAV